MSQDQEELSNSSEQDYDSNIASDEFEEDINQKRKKQTYDMPSDNRKKIKKQEYEEEEEDLDEDDLDDEEDYGRNKAYDRFFDDAAEEDEDEEEYDEDERHQKWAELQKQYERPSTSKRPEFMDINDEEVEDYFNKKVHQEQEFYDDHGQQILKEGQLPTINDPKLFAVRCKPEKERSLVIQLMNKYCAHMGTQKEAEMLVYSISSIDKFPGFLYIEADRETNVRNLIEDILDIYQNKIQIIPLKEVPLVFSSDMNIIELTKDQFVRVRRGLYENDLGKVVQYDEAKRSALVQLVPRIEEKVDEYDEYNENKGQQQVKKLNKIRPAQKLYHPRQTYNNTFDDYITENKQKFKDGYLFKKFGIKNLIYQDVIATLEELDLFVEGEESESRKLQLKNKYIQSMRKIQNSINKFKKGDKVKIVEGELKNMVAIVVDSQKDDIYVKPQIEQFQEIIKFKPSNLVKYFNTGDHVQILEGQHSNCTGVIVKITGYITTIILDVQQKEVNAMINNLKLTSQVFSKQVSEDTQQYKKFDLVKLNNVQNACIILRMNQDSLQVLDNNGYVVNTSYLNINQKIDDRHTTFKNRSGQVINLDSTVKVTFGIHKGKIGIVKHIFKNFLYLYNTDFQHTAGIFVENAHNCFLITNNLNNKRYSTVQYASQQQTQQGEEKPAENTQFKKPQAKGRDSLLGKEIMVKKGSWKGYQGIVKDSDAFQVRLELNSKCKTITVKRTDICLPNGEDEEFAVKKSQDQSTSQDIDYQNMGGRTGAYNPQSPWQGQGGQSPAFMPSPSWAKTPFN